MFKPGLVAQLRGACPRVSDAKLHALAADEIDRLKDRCKQLEAIIAEAAPKKRRQESSRLVK